MKRLVLKSRRNGRVAHTAAVLSVLAGLFAGGAGAIAIGPQNQEAVASVELVTLRSASPTDETTALPTAETELRPGETFYLEVWAQTTDLDGFASVYLDLAFDNAHVSAVTITHTDLFDRLTNGAIYNGTGHVDDVGGSHLAEAGCDDTVGAEPKWGRVFIVAMSADAIGTALIESLDAASDVLGISICDVFGDLDPATIEFGSITLNIQECFGDTDCDDSIECTDDLCVSNVCDYPPLDAGTPCGNQTPEGPCDNPDVCNGAGDCVPNYKPDTTECRPAEDVCDVAEFCPGDSADCPGDAVAPDTTECRGVADVCDVVELCDGVSKECPIDEFLPDTTECRAAADVCDIAEFCTGDSAACPADAAALDTSECRPAAGVCDVAEFCDGVSVTCPTDEVEPMTTQCRGVAGDCDVAEFCDGTSVDCPADSFLPDTTECRVAAGSCDIAEFCTGDSAACPTDELAPDTTVCRPSSGSCDPAERCTGDSVDCPANVMITECIDDDDCCPQGCVYTNDNDCPVGVIPAVAEWGLVIMALLLAVCAKVHFGRREHAAA